MSAARKSWSTASGREMDNPAISLLHQEDFPSCWPALAAGPVPATVAAADLQSVSGEWREEIIRGAADRLNTRALRNLAGVGNDNFAYNYMQSQLAALRARLWRVRFGAGRFARIGRAPSLLFEDSKYAARAANPSACRFCRLRR